MTRMTKLGVVVAMGALVGLAPSAHGQASFRPRFTAQAPIPAAVGPAAGRQAMALADVNADQRPDLVAIAPDDDQVAVRLNDGSGGFAAATSVDLQLTPTAVAVADVTSPFGGAAAGAPDGVPDLLIGGDLGELQILPGLGGGAFEDADAMDLDETFEIVGLAVGDFDGTAGADVAVLDVDGVMVLCNAAGVLAPCGTGGLLAVGDDPIEIVSGEFTGDGRADLAVLDRVDQRVWPLLGSGDGNFTPGTAVNVAGEASSGESVDLAVARMNDDALDDLVVVNYSDDFQFLGVTLLGTARGVFRSLAFVADFQASSLAVADFDGGDEGAADVIAGYADGGLTVNIGDGTGSLADPFIPVGSNTVGAVALLLAGDLNGDAAPDLVALHDGGDSVRVLLNATAPFCAGDCNANGTVTIEELTRGVNILLGEADPRDCIALDVDGNQMVTVDELVRAVNGALEGCPAS